MRVSRLFATVSAMGLLTGSLLVGGVHADSTNVPAITVGAPPGGAFLGGERADVVSWLYAMNLGRALCLVTG